MGIILITTLTLLTLSSRETVRSEFHRFKSLVEMQNSTTDIQQELDKQIAVLTEYFNRADSWIGINDVLRRFHHSYPAYDLYLFKNNGDLISSSSMLPKIIRLDKLGIISFQSIAPLSNGKNVVYALKSFAYVNININNTSIASLHAIETEIPLDPLSEDGFIQKINNRYTFMGVIACLFALILMIGLTLRVLKPISQLTTAVEAMSLGNIQQNVDARGKDEISILAKSFNLMSNKLVQSENHRKQMITDLAHELRTPLTIMRCQIDAVEDGLQTIDSNLVVKLSQELYSLQHLVSDLQDLSLLETGHLRVNILSFDIEHAINSVISSMQIEANIKHIKIIFKPKVRFKVVADQQRLKQILNNIIRNAINYSNDNSTILLETSENNNLVTIAVKDMGAGMSIEQQQSIFNRHYRVNAMEYPVSGQGLGLAIAKQLALAMKGDISVESQLGKGSIFKISLPSL